MRYLIIGLGVIARRHVENIRAIDPDAHIIAWRRAQASPTGENIDGVVTTLAAAVATSPEMALITNPAPYHIESGLTLAQHGVHLFIEKPISDRLEGIDQLIGLCQEKNLTLMVGYNFRFYQPFRVIRQALLDGMIGKPYSIRAQVGQYLTDWRPSVDYRESVSAQRSLGGGVVLELSHELDYVRWLMGEVDTVSAHLSQVSDLEIDVEDIAEITLGFHSGAVGNIHMNMVQAPVSRSCRIIGSEGTISWDQNSHQVLAFLAGDEAWRDISPAQPIDRNDSYMAEIQHFIECVNEGCNPDIDGGNGRRILEIALAAKRSSQDQCMVRL
jgi:predicted dehydrogenase